MVSNAHPELREYASKAVAAGATNIHMAELPCAGGIVEALMRFGCVSNPVEPAALLRGMVTQLGLLQSNALAGNLSLLAEPGATWVTPAGRVVPIVTCMGEPADAAASGLTWVDGIAVRSLATEGKSAESAAVAEAPASAADGVGADSNSSKGEAIGAGELLVVTYQLWSFKGQSRDSSRVRLCSAIVRAREPSKADGYKLLHLHEGVMSQDCTATAAFAALAAKGLLLQ